MSSGRISTYNLHQALLRDSVRAQSDLFVLQKQISSGIKSDNFAGLGSNVEQFADLESRLGRGQAYLDGNRIVQTRLDVADNALASIIETATDTKTIIGLRRSAAVGDSLAFITQLEGKWREIVSQFNVKLEGRYIFSGSATDTAAVSDTFPSLQVDGQPDSGYYQGNDEDMTMRIDDNIMMTYNVKGNDPAFQKIFAGIAMAREYGQSAGESAEMQQAYDLISQGVEEVIAVRATVNANKVSALNAHDRIQAQQLYWKGLKEEISNTDLVAASTEVAINQGILQASFQTFARISNLKLSDFLR